MVPGLFITTTSLPQVKSGALHGYMYYGDPYAVSLSGDDIGDTVKIQVNAPVLSTPPYNNSPYCTFSSSPLISSLFSGLTLNSTTGVISGNYSGGTVASTNVLFTVTNGIDTVSTTLPMSAVVSTLNISNVTIPLEPSGQAWTYQLVAQGGNPAYTWGLTSNLPTPAPPALSINGVFNNSNIKFNTYTGELSGNAAISGSFPVSFQVTDNSTVPAVFNKGFFLIIGANQVVTPVDPSYVGYISSTAPGNTLTLNPASNKSFTLRMTKVSSPTISVAALDPTIQAAVVSIIDSGGTDGRVATISISNIPPTTLGDHTFELNITDGTTVIPVAVKYKAIASRNITVTQASPAPLPTENV